MKNLRILFMGTPEFAVTILEGLLQTTHKVVGVITAPDRPAGRGQKLRKSAVKLAAEKNKLTILQPTNLKDSNFLEELSKLKADLQIVVAFRMLPKAVWQMPPLGTFNLHASLLPQYRGAAPINWALINGEQTTGVTTFFIDDKIDTGAIIMQDSISIGPNESAGQLHDRLMAAGCELVLKTVSAIAQDLVTTRIQVQSGVLKTAYKLNNENTKIDWTQDTVTIHNLIRGLNPYPGAWCKLYTHDGELRVKVYKAFAKATVKDLTTGTPGSKQTGELFEQAYPEGISKEEPGAITIKDKELLVHTQDGLIKIQELQLPGKRKMQVKDLLNGFKFSEKSKML